MYSDLPPVYQEFLDEAWRFENANIRHSVLNAVLPRVSEFWLP